jgi:formylglycine-generating enzyme required for sulfatase activity
MFWITWYDAVAFCNRLSELEGTKPYYRIADATRRQRSPSIIDATVTVAGGDGYRLPTEAQWEYACRAGTTTPYAFGKNLTAADANISGECKDVGSYRPNAWGLYDMHGNVCEWCQDWRGWDYYKKSPVEDPTGPASGRGRVIRGGSREGFVGWCRSAHRTENLPGSPMDCIGFRVAVGVGEPPAPPPAAKETKKASEEKPAAPPAENG